MRNSWTQFGRKSCKSAVTEPLYFMSKLGGAHILSAWVPASSATSEVIRKSHLLYHFLWRLPLKHTLISSDCVNLWLRRSNNRKKDISVRIRVQISSKCCKNIPGYFHFHSLKSLKDPSEHPSTPPKNQATPNFPLTLPSFLLQTSSGMIENKSISQRNVEEFFFFFWATNFSFLNQLPPRLKINI